METKTTNTDNHGNPQNDKKVYTFYIDEKEYTTENEVLTPKQILDDYAKVDSSKNTLAEKQGAGYTEYTDLNQKINMVHTVHHFTLFNNEPVTKS